MQKTVTLKQALWAWHEIQREKTDIDAHISDFDLLNISSLSESKKNIVVQHLLFCDECLEKFKDFAQETRQTAIAEVAWKKAAAGDKVRWPQILYSHNHTFKIEIRESEQIPNNGLISVKVLKDNDKLENRNIIILDGKGRNLLKGQIQRGQLFAKIENLADIDFRIMIRTMD